MPKIITEQSQMQCTLGAMPQPLKVTSQSLMKNSGKFVATEADKEGMTNIPSFGSCKRIWYNPPCKPMPIAWTNLSALSSILGKKQLTIASKCKCQYGGEISFIDTGSNIHESTE